MRTLLLRNRQRAEREVQLRVPFAVIVEAVEQLEADELRLLAQRLEERLAGMQPEKPHSMAQTPGHFSQTRHNADEVPDSNPAQGNQETTVTTA